MSMKRFGVNPHGESLWRVVFAPSVKKIVGGKFADGFTGYRVRPSYQHLGPVWVLEKWISAFQHTQMTEARYEQQYKDLETGLIPTGPYPSRGTYSFCEALNGNPADINFDWIIGYIRKGERNDPAQNAKVLLDNMERQEKADAAERFDRCKEMLPAFGIRATSYRGHVKATKSAPIMKSANELGLPKSGPSVLRESTHAV